jgi:predicted DNA-binding helix-hairpin-helix protein
MLRRKFGFLIKEYFSFTNSERTGIIVLMVLIVLSVGLRIFLSDTVNKTIYNIPSVQVKIDEIGNLKKGDITRNHYNKNTLNGSKPEIIHKIEINTCDSIALEKLPGIGPVLSKRIIKYRDILGGYYVKNQLLEVFGMSDEIYNLCSTYLFIDTAKIIKLDVNKATFKEINAHPYISYDQTKVICNTRRSLKFFSYDNFLHCGAFDSVQIKKVLVYLKFN